MVETSEKNQKEEFSLQYESLKDTQTSLINGTAGVASFLLLATGWLVTSNEARSFMNANIPLGFAAAGAVIATVALSIASSWNSFRTSNQIYDRMTELNYLPAHCFEHRRIKPSTLLICTIGIAVLAVLLVAGLISVTMA